MSDDTKFTYNSNRGTKYWITAHLIFVVKYCKPLLVSFGSYIKNKIYEISKRNDFDIITTEVDRDHIHILVSYSPKISISQIVRCLKSETTFHIWQKYEDILKYQFWKKRMFWSPSYFVCSTGQACQKTIEKYIMSQG